MKIRSTRIILLLSLTLGLSLISCNNFLKAEEVKNDIEQHIAYANAPSYKILIDYEGKTGAVKAPAGAETNKKVSDSFNVIFEPSADYEFINWKIIDSVTKKEYKNGEYLELESLTDPETQCKFIKEPEASIQLCLYAVVAERPYVLSKTPLYSATRSLRDATIQVMFDKKMDEGSIYFDSKEIDELKIKYKLNDDDFSYINPTKKEKCWCYKYDGNTYFKNITITNYKTNANINERFNAPVLNNYILTITANTKNPPASFSQILVTIEKDFYYTVGTKPVAMGRSEKWNYQVNDKTDLLPPNINTCNIGLGQKTNESGDFIELENQLTSASTCPANSGVKFIQNKKIYLDFEVTDDDGTIPPTFDVIIKKVKDSNYNSIQNSSVEDFPPIEYLSAGGKEGKFYGPVDLSVLDDGVYSMYLKITDSSNHSCTYPATPQNVEEPTSKFYFCLDTSVPKPEISYSNTTNSITITESSRPSDFKQATLKYKEQNEQNYQIKENVTDASIVISNLTAASNYEIELTYEDNAGNKNTSAKLYAKTKMEPPLLVKPETKDYNTDNSITVTWETVDTNWKKISLFAGTKETDVTNASYEIKDGKRRYTYTLSDLAISTKYSIKVQILKERPDGTVDDSVSDSKGYCTRPDKPSLKDVKKEWVSNQWKAEISWDYSDFNNGEYYYKTYDGSETKINSSSKTIVIYVPANFGGSKCGTQSYKIIKRLKDDWNYSHESESSSKTAYFYPDVTLNSVNLINDPECSFSFSYSDGPTPSPSLKFSVELDGKEVIRELSSTNRGNLCNAYPGAKVTLVYYTSGGTWIGKSDYYLPDNERYYTNPGLVKVSITSRDQRRPVMFLFFWDEGDDSSSAEDIIIYIEDPSGSNPKKVILPVNTSKYEYYNPGEVRRVKFTVYTRNRHYEERLATHVGSGGQGNYVEYTLQ